MTHEQFINEFDQFRQFEFDYGHEIIFGRTTIVLSQWSLFTFIESVYTMQEFFFLKDNL